MKLTSAIVAWLLAILGIEAARRIRRDAVTLQGELDDIRKVIRGE